MVDEIRTLEVGAPMEKGARCRRSRPPRERCSARPRHTVCGVVDARGHRHARRYGDKARAGGGNVGTGFVSGVRSDHRNDSAIKGGAITPMGLQDPSGLYVALRERLPVVSMVESVGANLLYQSEIFVDAARCLPLARLSAADPDTIVHGRRWRVVHTPGFPPSSRSTSGQDLLAGRPREAAPWPGRRRRSAWWCADARRGVGHDRVRR